MNVIIVNYKEKTTDPIFGKIILKVSVNRDQSKSTTLWIITVLMNSFLTVKKIITVY